MRNAHGERGFTLLELIVVVAIIGIVAAIAVPGLLRARVSGNEASAIGSLRAISSGQSTYSASCGSNGYAQDLADLAKPPIGSSAGFISPDLSTNGVIKSGYVVNLIADSNAATVTSAANTCNGSSKNSVTSYFSEAHPLRIGSSGQRSFGTDARGTIYFNNPGVTVVPGMPGAAALQ